MDLMSQNLVAEVLAPVAVDQCYSYDIPDGLLLAPGDFVTIPLGARKTMGVVWGFRDAILGERLKKIVEKRDLPPFDEKFRRFLDWVAQWTLSQRGMVLRMATRAAEDAEDDFSRVGVRATGLLPARATPARSRALAAAIGDLATTKAELARAAGVSASVIDGLIDEGALETVALPPALPGVGLDPSHGAPKLSDDQQAAAKILREAAARQKFAPILLEGVTGSGKTEVYFEAIAEILQDGGQALILLPEIALTNQFLERFSQRFGGPPAEWHSGISPRRRAKIWRETARGKIKVVAGARSGLFLPFADLRLIVVDEEHEAAYKQEDGAIYHARDMAVVRARQENCAIILASATPSIETRENARSGRYQWVRLKTRFSGRNLPKMTAIDLRRDAPPRGKWISPKLAAAMAECFAAKEQALLFLNRRGYAPLTLCKDCGHRFECPNCSATLVEHRHRRALICHHCGHVERRPELCPACGAADSLIPCGPGVERIAEEAAGLFPDQKMLVLSSDAPGGMARMRAELEGIEKGEFDLVIGTQLVAKGHHFPLLTLVGVIDADVGLNNGDPRAAERTFQLLNQVAGRAGRAQKPGRAFLQTYQPDHPVIATLLSGDFEGFYDSETDMRRLAGLPPFGRMASLIVSGPDRAAAEQFSRLIAGQAHVLADEVNALGAAFRVLGPAEPPLAFLRGKYRFRLLVQCERRDDLQRFLRSLLTHCGAPRGGLRVVVDVDPQNFL